MKTLILAFVLLCILCACGSQWTIRDNEFHITRVETDTIVKAGCFIATPVDSLK